MKLQSKNFAGCGFPEEYMFWILVIIGLAIILSYIFLHGFVRSNHKKLGFFPVILLVFNKSAFYGRGTLLRKVFLLSCLLCALLAALFQAGYHFGFLDCGIIDK